MKELPKEFKIKTNSREESDKIGDFVLKYFNKTFGFSWNSSKGYYFISDNTFKCVDFDSKSHESIKEYTIEELEQIARGESINQNYTIY